MSDSGIEPFGDGFYLACLQESSIGMVVLDQHLCIHFWNRWMERASGWPAREVVGRILPEFLPELVGSRLLETLQNGVETGLPAILSHKLNPSPLPLYPPSTLPGEGERMQQMLTIKALTLAGQRVLLLQVQDVTGAMNRERQLRLQTRSLEAQEVKLRESEELFRGIIETAPVGLAIFGCEGHKGGLCNTRMQEMLTLEPGSFGGTPLPSLLADPVQAHRFIEVVQVHGVVREMELRFVTRNKRPLWGLVSARRISIGGEPAILLGVVDISQRKEMEDKLFAATREAQQASRAKSQFLANMSHEIRTPLNAVIGLTSLAMERCDDTLLREYLEKISYAGRSLLGLLNNLLDFSKIEAGKLELEKIPFLLEDVLSNVGGMFCAPVAEKGLEIFLYRELGVPNALMGDPLRLGQILINLVNNAIKFTPKGEVVVSVGRVKNGETGEETRLRFSVRDTGVGMTATQMERIFESFEQADGSISRRFGGSGLGLSICRRLVELMGGKIRVESQVDRGSLFHFDVPMQVQTEAQELDAGQSAPVLLLGDNVTSLVVAAQHLRLMGFQPHGPYRDPPPSPTPWAAILVDWREEGMPPLERQGWLHALHDRYPMAMVVVLVPFGRDDLRRRCHQSGERVACLVKPLQYKRLRAQLIERREQAEFQSPKDETRRKLNGVHVLLVEDSIINQQVAVEILEQVGVKVSVAAHGREALAMLPGLGVHAVLMDVQMPVLNGIETTRLIREDSRFAELPVIAMTASALNSDRERCLKAGMVDYISKPIEPRDLYATLVKWVKPVASPPVPVVAVEEEGEEDFLPSYLPGIDLASVMERMEGNAQLFRRIMTMFVEKYADAPGQIRAAVERGEWEVVRRLAHTLKGSAGSLSATALAATAQVLEMSVRRNEREAVPVVLNALEAALATVVKSHGMLAATGRHAAGEEEVAPPVGSGEIMVILAELESLLASNNLDALGCLDPLMRMLRGRPGAARELEALERHVGALEFEAALEHVRAIRPLLGERLPPPAC